MKDTTIAVLEGPHAVGTTCRECGTPAGRILAVSAMDKNTVLSASPSKHNVNHTLGPLVVGEILPDRDFRGRHGLAISSLRRSFAIRWIGGVAQALGRSVGFVLFITLKMLRGPLHLIVRLGIGFFLLASLVVFGLASLNHWQVTMLENARVLVCIAVVLSAALCVYDALILYLTPRGYQVSLWN